MKRIISLLLTAVMLIGCVAVFASCGKEDDGEKLVINGFSDLNGLTLSFQGGTVSDDIITALIESGELEATVLPNEKILNCFTQLANGEIDAVVCDSTVAEGYVATNGDKYEIAWKQSDNAEEFGVAMGLENSALQTAVNQALSELKAEGYVDALVNKWFGDASVEVQMPTEKTVDTSAITLMSEGKLLVGAEIGYPPFEDYASDGVTPVGFDIDLMKGIAAKLGLEVEFINTAWEGIFLGIDQNYDCVCSAVSINDERKLTMSFSDPYIQNYQSVVIAKK